MAHRYPFNSCFSLFVFLLCAVGSNAQPQWFETGTEYIYHYNQNPDLPTDPLISRQARFQVTEQTEFLDRNCARIDFLPETDEDAGLICRLDTSVHYFYTANDSLFVATELSQTWQLACYFGAEPGDWWLYTVYEGPQFGLQTSVHEITVESVENVELSGVSLRKVFLSSSLQSGGGSGNFYIDQPVTEIVGALNAFILPPGDAGSCDGYFNLELQCCISNSFAYTNPDFSSCSLGIDNAPEKFSVLVFPNPASEIINIQIPEAAQEGLRVVDLTGRVVAQVAAQNISPNDLVQLNVSDLRPGMYFIGRISGTVSTPIFVGL